LIEIFSIKRLKPLNSVEEEEDDDDDDDDDEGDNNDSDSKSEQKDHLSSMTICRSKPFDVNTRRDYDEDNTLRF